MHQKCIWWPKERWRALRYPVYRPVAQCLPFSYIRPHSFETIPKNGFPLCSPTSLTDPVVSRIFVCSLLMSSLFTLQPSLHHDKIDAMIISRWLKKKNREIDEEKNNIHYNRVGVSFQEGDNKNTINTTSNIERRMVVTAPHRIAQQQLTKAKLAENLKKRKEGRKEGS